jgi:hypothetical protein
LAGNLIRGDDLEKILTAYLKSIEVSQPRTVARLLIEQLRSRNFILCFLGADSYGFVHRTFLEYFCACEFIERFGKRGLEGGLTFEELKTEVFGKHWQDESWHEVLRLIAGMIDTSFAGQIIDYLIEQNDRQKEFINLLLAAKCLSEVRTQSETLTIGIKLLDYSLNNAKGSSYGISGIDHKFIDSLKITFSSNLSQVVSAVVTAYRDYPEILYWLKNAAQMCIQPGAHTKADVTATAMQKLAEGWKDDPDILPFLKACTQLSKSSTTRLLAAHQLAEGWKDDPDILPILKTHAQVDESSFVRLVALYELARGWKDEPGMFELIYNQAINDPFVRQRDWPNPRLVALEAIISQYPNHLQTLSLLFDRAKNDSDYQVRMFAVRDLIQSWKDEPGMFEFLYNCALNDPFERKEDWEDNPRQTALEAIIKQYPDHPQTLPLLQDRAENDSDKKVREFAKKKLAELDQ